MNLFEYVNKVYLPSVEWDLILNFDICCFPAAFSGLATISFALGEVILAPGDCNVYSILFWDFKLKIFYILFMCLIN